MAYWKFISTEKTETECFLRRLFGHTDRVVRETGEALRVAEGDTLFLHQWRRDSRGYLSGPFVAASDAGKWLQETAWKHKNNHIYWQVEIDWDQPIYSVSVAKIEQLDSQPLTVEDHPQPLSDVTGLWLEGFLKNEGIQTVHHP
ncbi:hypothetical protein DVK00_18780 [Haloarcula sp. Atlit-47R]|uniref:hypothetical protein n=1 Tax=Haloarcula sp. Atlit-47R TaxID=2282132 RepID=UPI000EF232A2|nr:hypothetical protein [Haloarcula sp. Atlit-47R]RLM41887.1 hypothetical protein DVK00_18780 [Haloarcula sp. Atlit-47R]